MPAITPPRSSKIEKGFVSEGIQVGIGVSPLPSPAEPNSPGLPNGLRKSLTVGLLPVTGMQDGHILEAAFRKLFLKFSRSSSLKGITGDGSGDDYDGGIGTSHQVHEFFIEYIRCGPPMTSRVPFSAAPA